MLNVTPPLKRGAKCEKDLAWRSQTLVYGSCAEIEMLQTSVPGRGSKVHWNRKVLIRWLKRNGSQDWMVLFLSFCSKR